MTRCATIVVEAVVAHVAHSATSNLVAAEVSSFPSIHSLTARSVPRRPVVGKLLSSQGAADSRSSAPVSSSSSSSRLSQHRQHRPSRIFSPSFSRPTSSAVPSPSRVRSSLIGNAHASPLLDEGSSFATQIWFGSAFRTCSNTVGVSRRQVWSKATSDASCNSFGNSGRERSPSVSPSKTNRSSSRSSFPAVATSPSSGTDETSSSSETFISIADLLEEVMSESNDLVFSHSGEPDTSPDPLAPKATPSKEASIQDISVHDLNAKLHGSDVPFLVDVRSEEEYASGHVPGAVNAPLDKVVSFLNDGNMDLRDRDVAVICARGNRSLKAANALLQSSTNFRTILNVLGGTLGWIDAGLPADREVMTVGYSPSKKSATVVDVAIRNQDGENLRGSMMDTGSKELCVICHGFRSSMQDDLIVTLATALVNRGVSSFCFDFSGNGSSEGKFSFGNYWKEVEDLRAVLEYWRDERRREIACVIGHSKGGSVALLYVSKYQDVQSIVNIAGRFRMDFGLRERFGDDGMREIYGDGYLDVFDKKGNLQYRITLPELQERLSVDMDAACRSIRQSRVLTVHGTNDNLSPLSDAHHIAKSLPPSLGHVLRIVDGANHFFKSKIDQLVDAVVSFVTDDPEPKLRSSTGTMLSPSIPHIH